MKDAAARSENRPTQSFPKEKISRRQALRKAAAIAIAAAVVGTGALVSNIWKTPEQITSTTGPSVTRTGRTWPPPETPAEFYDIMRRLPDYYPEDYWKLIKASRDESKVLVYGGGVDQAILERIVDNFKSLYPFLTVDFIRGSTGTIAQKYLTEVDAGATSGDVVTTIIEWLYYMYDKKYALAYTSPEKKFLPTEFDLWPNTAYPWYLSLHVMAYNNRTTSSERVPKGYSNLAAMVKQDTGFWKGRLGNLDHTVTSQSVIPALVKALGDSVYDWYTAYASAGLAVYPTGARIMSDLVSGQLYLGIQVGSVNYWPVALAQPGLLDLVYPEEGTPALLVGGFISKQAKNPNSAKLFLDFMLNRNTAQVFAENKVVTFRSDMPKEYSVSGLREKTKLIFVNPNEYTQEFADSVLVKWASIVGIRR